MATSCQIVLSTCPDMQTANRISRNLVEEKLATCISIIPQIQSVYRWQGKVETASEYLLLIKANSRLFEAICDKICSLHPYELPEIVTVPIVDGLPQYLSWLSNPE